MSPAGVLAVHDLHFGYGQRADVLEAVEHEFAPGAVTAVTGLSGSGKSTLLYLLGLMLTPMRGSVVLGGRSATDLPDRERAMLRARHVGFVFQDAVLDPARTCLDNVAEAALLAGMDRRAARRLAHAQLARFGLAHRSGHRPGEISGGQAQRIALCRALVKTPSVLLADEPTGNLDLTAADQVWDALGAAAGAGVTVVVATHDTVRASAADARLVVGG